MTLVFSPFPFTHVHWVWHRDDQDRGFRRLQNRVKSEVAAFPGCALLDRKGWNKKKRKELRAVRIILPRRDLMAIAAFSA